jgi:hypothetical protein
VPGKFTDPFRPQGARMTGEQAARAFALRMALSQAGYTWRACDPDGDFVPIATISESGVNLLITDYPEATETAIWADGKLTIVTEVPLTEAQAEAKRIAEEEERQAALVAEERARQEALIEAARAKERERKATKRRAQGKPTRDEWLAERGATPWVEAGMSRRTWYRRQNKLGSAQVVPGRERPD